MAVLSRMAATAVVVGLATALAGPAAASPTGPPPTSGCPGGQLLSVAELESVAPYVRPREIDEAGNADGYVCGHPLPQVAAERAVCGGPCPVPVVYLFRDNDLAGYEP